MSSVWLVLAVTLPVPATVIYLGLRSIRRRELAEIQRFEQFEPTEDDNFVVSLGLTGSAHDALKAIALRAALRNLAEFPHPPSGRNPFYQQNIASHR